MKTIVFDTEDDSAELLEAGKSGFDKKLLLTAAIDCDTGERKIWRGESGREKFLDWLISMDCVVKVYAHNLQYDLGNLFPHKIDDLDVVLVGGRLIRADWGNKIRFRDSYNLFPMSLKVLGSSIGLEKKEFDVNSEAYVFQIGRAHV